VLGAAPRSLKVCGRARPILISQHFDYEIDGSVPIPSQHVQVLPAQLLRALSADVIGLAIKEDSGRRVGNKIGDAYVVKPPILSALMNAMSSTPAATSWS
jgi:hypothetical protein